MSNYNFLSQINFPSDLKKISDSDLEKVSDEYTESKMQVVRKHLGKIAHEIFLVYGHKKDLDFSAHPIVDKFDELGLTEDPRSTLKIVKETITQVA